MVSHTTLHCGSRRFVKGEGPVIMGIINVTPDSFSDGMACFDPQSAIKRGVQLLEHGADVLDIGGVSTAPGAPAVGLEQERERILPVIGGLIKLGITNICVDTTRAVVALEALELGAAWINDQSAGLFDEKMPSVMVQAQGVVLMHNRGEPGVQAGEQVFYDDLLGELSGFFNERTAALTSFGVAPEKIIIDPGIGFGKGLADSLKIIANINRLSSCASWSLLGVSRKSFLGKLTGVTDPKERDFATLGANLAGIMNGADMVRTHHVKAMVDMLKVFRACNNGEGKNENLYSAGR